MSQADSNRRLRASESALLAAVLVVAGTGPGSTRQSMQRRRGRAPPRFRPPTTLNGWTAGPPVGPPERGPLIMIDSDPTVKGPARLGPARAP